MNFRLIFAIGLILLNLDFTTPLTAEVIEEKVERVRNQVIKVYSRFANLTERVRTGSAVLFSHENELWALTNSHVIFHGTKSQGVRNTFLALKGFGEDPISGNLEVRAINFANDLALLKVDSSSIVAEQGKLLKDRSASLRDLLQDINKLREEESSGKKDYVVAGFASALDMSGTLASVVNNVTVRNTHYYFSTLPLVNNLILIDGHTERGMSGGGLFTAEGKLRGLILEQFIEQRAGAPVEVVEDGNHENATGHAVMMGLAVPMENIASWLSAVLNGSTSPTMNLDLREDLALQKNHTTGMAFEDLLFQEIYCAEGNVGGDAAGIGGDAAGIGGDASGIGGDSDRTEKPKFCKVEITKVKKSQTAWPFNKPKWFEHWMGMVRYKLNLGCKLTIQKVETEPGKRLSLTSLNMFFTKIHRNSAIPLLRIEECSQQDLNEDEQRLITLGMRIEALVKDFEVMAKDQKEAFDEEIILLIKNIGEFADDLRNKRFELITNATLRSVSASQEDTAGQRAWDQILANEHFNRSEMRKALELYRLVDEASELLKTVIITAEEK